MHMFASILRYLQRYEEVTSTTKTCITNTRYGSNAGTGATCTFTLPAILNYGDRIGIIGIAGNTVITPASGQRIRSGILSTTTLTGTISATPYFSIQLISSTATGWIVDYSMGTLTWT
jgi:hypothetical protein